MEAHTPGHQEREEKINWKELARIAFVSAAAAAVWFGVWEPFGRVNVNRASQQDIQDIADLSPSEAAAIVDPGPGAAWSYVAVVEQWRDPAGWTAMAWATDPLLAGWAKGQVVESATIDGHVAAKVTNGPRFSVAYYVQDAGRMFVVGYKVDAPDWKPSAAMESDLRAIVATFHVSP